MKILRWLSSLLILVLCVISFPKMVPAPVCPIDSFLDIKPGSDTNAINLKAHGVLPVAILGSDIFDVDDIDISTLSFGPDAASPVHSNVEDVNDDGFDDLVLHFLVQETGISPDDELAWIEGNLNGGFPFCSADYIVIVP